MRLIHLLIIALLPLTGCLRMETAEPSIGEAFVAPATLEIREEIAPRARLAATLGHGDRVEVLARRRRFAKVRVPPGGATGWTDGRQLLSGESWTLLRAENEQGARAPAQGTARAAAELNVHITPHRGAPSFHRLKEGELITNIGRSVMPRMQYVAPGEESGQLVSAGAAQDDWSWIRLKDRRCGWVLASMLMPELPLEILQLADGHRVTAFFQLGVTRSPDDGKERPVYLWTASSGLPDRFQFDSVKVFAWNPARQRYETTFVERGVEGYHPVIVDPASGTVQIVYASAPGERVERHTFEYRDRKLKRLAREPWQKPEPRARSLAQPLADAPVPAGLWARAAEWLGSWRR